MQLEDFKEYYDLNLSYEDFDGLETLSNVSFTGCTIKGANLQDFIFNKCSFEDCSFEECNLALIKISYCRILDVKFIDCKLIGVYWENLATPFSASYIRCDLSYNVFIEQKLRSFLFDGCKIVEANFSKANLSKAKMINCELTDSAFTQTDIRQADFRGSMNYFGIDPASPLSAKAVFDSNGAIALLARFGVVIKE